MNNLNCEFYSRKVVEHNDLISSVAKMDKIPLKIFELAVSCIDTISHPKDNIVYLSKNELFAFFDVSDNDRYRRFKNAMEKLQKQAFFKIKEVEKKGGIKYKQIIPIPYIEWNDYSDKVTIRFDQAILPYLIDLKKDFTQYAISDIIKLNSKYSIVMYKWLCMYYNQFDHYKHKSIRKLNQLEQYQNPEILVEDLRVLTDSTHCYSRFDNFENRVLKNSINEINLYTHLTVKYIKIKKGRLVNSIKFFVEKKYNLQNECKKDKNIQEQLSNIQLVYASAVANPYTIKLIDAGLLYALDIANQDTMVCLSKYVYPLYDMLVKELGKDVLETHLHYVKYRMIDCIDSKKNIIAYLRISAKQYISSRLSQKQMKN